MLPNLTAWIILDKHVVNEIDNPSVGERIYYYSDILRLIDVSCIHFWADGSRFINEPRYIKNEIKDLHEEFSRRNPDFALIYSWHDTSPVFEWLRDKKIPIINVADSDGRIGLKYAFSKNLKWRLRGQKSYFKKLGAIKDVGFKWIFNRDTEIKKIIRNAEISDVVTFGSPGCSKVFNQILSFEGERELEKKVFWLPFPTSEIYYSDSLVHKKRQIIVVHNWDSNTGINKNPGIVQKVIKNTANVCLQFRFLIIGKGSGRLFDKALGSLKNIELIEHLDKTALVQVMKESMILFTASDYEGSPLVVNEILGCGGTFVTGPLPSTVGLLEMKQGSGTVSNKFDFRSLTSALNTEIEMWDKGARNPNDIAGFWKQHFSNVGIANKFKTIIEKYIINI